LAHYCAIVNAGDRLRKGKENERWPENQAD
jgi:hypothetical protein